MVLTIKLYSIQGKWVSSTQLEGKDDHSFSGEAPLIETSADPIVSSSLSASPFHSSDLPPPYSPTNVNQKEEDDVNHTPIGIDDDEKETTTHNADNSNFVTPLSPSSISHPNNSETKPLFRFKNYGNKNLANGTKRLYFKCTFKGCLATYQTTSSMSSPPEKNTKQSNNTNTAVIFFEEHNHIPPSNPRTRPEVKEKALSQMSAGATPSNVHAEFVRNAPLPLSSADVPSLAQLKTWKHEFSMKDMPTGIILIIFSLTPFPQLTRYRRCVGEHHL